MTEQQLEARVRRLEAVEEILLLKAAYCQHCDNNYDPLALAKLFTEDAVWDGGPTRGTHRGRAAIQAFFAEIAAVIPFAAHLVTNPIIAVETHANTATGEWRMLMPCTMQVDGKATAMLQVANYSERYRRVSQSWLISAIKVRIRRLSIADGEWVDLALSPLHGESRE